MGTSAVQDDPMLRLQYYRETGQADEAKNYEAYLRETGQLRDSRPSRASLTARRMTRLNQNEAEAAAIPDYATQALGGIASLAREIPGVEALQAGARAVVRGQPYREALTEIRGAEDDAPKWVRRLNRVLGGTAAAMAMPGSAIRAGASYGASSGLLQADPVGMGGRAKGATLQGAAGAAAGKIGEMALTAGRAAVASRLGERALERKAAISAADAVNYGKAAREADAASPQSILALRQPDIAPYADAVRNSRQFAGADDATVLREAYKLMSEQSGKLQNRMYNANDYKAGTSLESADTKLAKDELLSAADAVMPSFRPAVQRHATMAAERDAFRSGADAARRVLEGTKVAGKKLETNSLEAFMATIKKMSPSDAAAAKEGVLGRLKEYDALTPNPLKLFGVPKSISNLDRISKILQALDRQAGSQLPSFNAVPIGATGLLN